VTKTPFADRNASKEDDAKQREKYQPKRANAQVPFNGYVRCDMVRTDKDAFNAWSKDKNGGDLWTMILKLIDDGYKFTVGYKGLDMIAHLSCNNPKSPAYGYILTAFGRDADEATCALLYKHYVKLDEDWLASEGDDSWGVR